MRKLFLFIAVVVSISLNAQRHEIGVFLGGANGITDIGRTNYINPVPPQMQDGSYALPFVFGGMYRYNLDPQFGLRANLLFSRIAGNDLTAVEDYRFERGYEYKNTIIETSILLEYNFFDFNTIQKNAQTPYIFVGLGAFAANDREYQITHTVPEGSVLDTNNPTGFTSTLTSSESLNFNLAVPFGVGYKIKYNWQWVFSFEVGARYTNTDNLDYSIPEIGDFNIVTDPALLQEPFFTETNTRNTQFITSRQTGDVSDKDWYVFTGLGVTYTFGRPPCYCN